MQPNDIVRIELTAAETNTVLGLLAEGPYRVDAPLILKITRQAQGQEITGGPPVQASNGAERQALASA